MNARRLVLFLAAFVAAAGGWNALAQNPPAPQPLKAEKIRDDLYVIMGDGGNATALVTDEGVILVDSKNDRNHDELVARVKTLTDKPIKYVINTHAHADHTGGNQKLLPAAQLVGHVNLRGAMINAKLPGAPPLTYTDQMSVFLGGKEVALRHFGRCHTDGDTFVYFPAHKVLAMGDCFNTGNGRGLNPTGSSTPGFYVDYTTGGSLRSFPKAADAALKLDWDVVVPGHGPLTNRAGFLKWRKDIDALTNRVSGMVREGKPATDIRDVLIKEFGWETMGAPIRSVDGMMAELK
jgi:glyoxylase-like metal-dependent hydrolase (beta-lactamase superfamily II)